jgi:putative heme-binding domain-containing protein
VSHLISSILLVAVLVPSQHSIPAAGAIEQQLCGEDATSLARDARRLGDARRGALLFYQPAVACAKCHLNQGADGPPPLGPDLTKLGKDLSDVALVESILYPSKVIKKGYETITIVTDDGQTETGLMNEERPDAVVLRSVAHDGKSMTIAKRRIEVRHDQGPSIMPAGLVNMLSSRQQFLDLIRYIMEIAEYGPSRVRALRPDPLLLTPTLPNYERNLDHAGMITELGTKHLERGEVIYNRVCSNCHGTQRQPGSLPAAPRFGFATLRNGSDPYRMYRILTDGSGQMAAQTWMVPQQKYDVIHYIREVYLKSANPSQYVRIDRAYLNQLPKGTSRGPIPSEIEPWVAMDYGPSLTATYEVSDDNSNFAFKGIAVRLDPGRGGISRGRTWVIYDQDTLRLAAAWTGTAFIDWNGINFNGRHQVHPRIVGKIHLSNPNKPGWANPSDGSFTDLRLSGRDGRFYGPLPRSWAHYKGLYRYGDKVVLAYTVGTSEVLEMPGIEIDPAHPDNPIFTRTLQIGVTRRDLTMQVAPEGITVILAGNTQASLFRHQGFILLRIPRSEALQIVEVLISDGEARALQAYAASSPPGVLLQPLTQGGPQQWPEILKTQPAIGHDDGPLAVDVLTVPDNNPWLCQMRLSGFDFLPDGRRAVVCTWDGDVWLVDGINAPVRDLTWQRIASGLFQPLGLKIVAGRIYVGCRDQIVCLRDFNGDGETDFYENFNNDHQVTEHFHEFAMGLQADSEGNFYYAKAARHGLPAVVPHHGTLLRVSKDGLQTEILATGFRASNGVCINPDGSFFLSDQEGFWTPKNRINWVKRGGFYGNMWGYHDITDSSDTAMEPPVCWITNAFDRSPAELVWATSTNPAWRPLRGALLSLSYGNGKIFVVPHERIDGQMQGGVCALPIPPLPTGVMRGRFHPTNGHLYTCGLFAWAGDRTQPGGFYCIRATGKPMFLPVGLNARRRGLLITFTEPLDRESSCNPSCYTAKSWGLKRTAQYGSDHYDERLVQITKATISGDGHAVFLEIPELRPNWCMEVTYAVRAKSGDLVEGVIHNTIHHLHD